MSTTCKMLKSADGTSIYADATGNPQNPSIVFIHGMALTCAVFDQLFAHKELLEKFYLVRYDMRGHGRSGKPETEAEHISLLYANDFEAVVHGFGLKKPAFVGWSLGAAIIADICINLHPLPISGAISLSGSPLFHADITPIAFTDLCLSLGSGLVSNDTSFALSGRREFVYACLRDAESLPFSLTSAWIGYTTFQTPTLAALVRRRQDSSKLLQMKKADLRLLILCGNEDKMIDGIALAKEMKRGKYFGDVEVELKVIEGGSHSLFLDNVEETVDTLIEFVESIQPPNLINGSIFSTMGNV